MEIKIEITRKDFQKFNLYAAKKNKALKRFKLVPVIFLILIVLLLNIKEISNITYMVIQIAFILFLYLAFVLLFKPITALITKYTPAKDGGTLGEHKFRISDEGLWESTEYNESLTKWNGIKSIETTKKYIFVFIDTHMAHIIPKRYFKSEEDSENFIDTLRSKGAG
jgi:hypothetical protein